MDSIRIKLEGDGKGLDPLKKGLEDIGKIDKQNADNFKKNQQSLQQEAIKTANTLKGVADATKGVFANETIDRINKATVHLGGLRNSINQLTRELPAFTFSAQTGFLAISNNIPILMDEIGRLKKANAELTAGGGQAIPIWRQLASSFFSLGTVMSIGATLLTVYGKEIGNAISGLFGAEEASDAYKASTDELNKAIKRSIDLEIELVRARGQSTELLERDKFVNAYKESVGAVASAETQIALLKENTAKQESIINSNRSEEVKNIAIEQKEANDKILIDLQKALEAKVQKQKNAELELSAFEAKISKAKIDEAEKGADKEIKVAERAAKEKERIDQQEWEATLRELKALESIQLNSDARIQAANEVNIKRQIETQDDGLQKELELFELNAQKEIKIAEDKGEDLIILEALQAKQRQDIKDKYNAKERSEYEKLLKAESDAREKQIDEEMALLEQKAKEQEQLQKATADAFIQSFQTIINTGTELEKADIEASKDRQLEALSEEKERKLSNKRLTDKQRISLEKEFAAREKEIQKKAFEEKKKADIAQAIINTAVGVVKTYATLGYPLGIPAPAALAIAGAAEIAIINKQKFEKGGLVKGKRHSEGGVQIEVEGEEFITNRNATAKNLELLKAVNDGKGEAFIFKKYVLPAIIDSKMAAKKDSVSFGNLAEMIALNSKDGYDDYYLRQTIKESSKQSAKYIAKELKPKQVNNSRYF